MAGRRRSKAGLASALDTFSALMANEVEEKQRRKRFAEELVTRLQVKMLEREFERGAIGFDEQGNIVRQEPEQAFDPVASGLEPSSYKDPATGMTYTRPKPEPEPKFLSQQDGSTYLNPARPGQPFPTESMPIISELTSSSVGPSGTTTRTNQRYVGQGGGLPTTPEAFNTLQGAINMGRTESPAAQIAPPTALPAPIPQPQPQSQTDWRAQAMSALQGAGVGAVMGPGGAMLGALNPFRDKIQGGIQGAIQGFRGGQATGGQPNPVTQDILSDLQAGALSPDEFIANIDLFASEGVDVEFIRQAMGL